MKLDRRGFLAAGAAAALLRPGVAQAVSPLNLGADAADRGIVFGSAFDREIFDDTAYAALLRAQCRIGSLENSLKFDWLKPTGNVADFSASDRLVDFAVESGIRPRGTALIWNDWLPDWLKWTTVLERRSIMEKHIDEVVGRYAGRVQSWDVVNEPFFPPHGIDGGYRKGLWLDAMGPDYIIHAFKRAAAADPKAQLVLNEAFCEQDDELGKSIRPLLLNEVKRLQDAGVKLDAIGFEAHLRPELPYDDQAFVAYVAEIAALGVDVMITELDVNDSHMPDDEAERDAQVAARVHDFLGAVLQVPRVTTVITWHLSDRYSWYRGADWYADQVRAGGGTPGRPVRSHLYDDQLQPKAAAFAARDALKASGPH
ncbi:Exoglucanase/xylanase [Alphaproteobacteria bacterium SO-S41]|nr:Exoglucanase/xylanase [Alphaproteobacteria bacterium SO-S41]